MRSDRALRACMQALVLLDLLFVQMTGAAGLHWLAPLMVLTLCAPLLERHRERLAYRALWNGGVVCFSLVLLRHATRADLAYVLEDGLVLAVLCQVHLLNNLRSSQRPDLLFFNAFLIAIITGFLNRGLGFPLAFLAFAPCFVIGLQLLSATREGHVLSPADTRRLVLDGGRRAGLLLTLTMLVFLLWPRDFERGPLFRARFDLPGDSPSLEVGFSDKLVLERSGAVEVSDRETLRVTLLQGTSAQVPALWRGATLGDTSGGSWSSEEPAARSVADAPDERWLRRRGALVRAGGVPSDAARVEVVRHPQDTERLFLPLQARALQLAPEHAGALVRARLDGTVDTTEEGEVRYELRLAGAPESPRAGPRAQVLPEGLAPYVELPDSLRIERARRIAARLAERLPADAEQARLVELVREHLSRSYVYLPPGAEGAAHSLDAFLAGEGGGHCEFFASALATMLRSLNVPCRVVTGFRSSRWDAGARVLSFGSRDAHAWVEVHDPGGGWYAVDPSPRPAEEVASSGPWARLRARARSAWETVTRFDPQRRAALYAWVRGLPSRGLRTLADHPLAAGLACVLLVLATTLVVRRRRARTRPAVQGYRGALRRAGLRLAVGETPRELLERARGLELPPGRLQALEQATRQHEAQRYAA